MIGIVAEENDVIYQICGIGGSEFVYLKTVDSIKIGDREAFKFPKEVGAMNYSFELNGIIGLDLLQHMKAMINVEKLIFEFG